MEQFNKIGLKTIKEFLKEKNLSLDIGRNSTNINEALKNKVLFNLFSNTFYRVSSRSSSWYNDQVNYLYHLGYESDYNKIINSTNLIAIKTSSGLIHGGHNSYKNLVIVGEYSMSKREQINSKIVSIQNDIHKKANELSFEQGKISYMDENSLEEFDENEYKVYNALKTLDSNASTYEKAKVIAEIIKQK